MIKKILRFGLRYKLKSSIYKLKGDDREEYFSNLRVLHRLDPYPYLLWALAVVVTAGLFSLRLAVFFLGFYLLWLLLFLVVFKGVSLMHKDALEKQSIREESYEKGRRE